MNKAKTGHRFLIWFMVIAQSLGYVCILALFTLIIPVFGEMYMSFGDGLPKTILWLFGFSDVAQRMWPVLFAVNLVVIYFTSAGVLRYWNRSKIKTIGLCSIPFVIIVIVTFYLFLPILSFSSVKGV